MPFIFGCTVQSYMKKIIKKNVTLKFLVLWALFESPFTHGARLGIPPNFAKTRFGRFPTFHFSTSKFFSKLRTAVYPPRMAPFGLKLWENSESEKIHPSILVFSWLSEINLIEKPFFENFERPFTPQTCLRSARNFAKTRFG